MSWATPGLSPAATRLHRLLDDAAADGHTVVPVAVAGSVLGGAQLRLENALREIGPSGTGLVGAPNRALLGFRRHIDAEQAIASAVTRLAADGRLRIVAGPSGAPRDDAARSFAAGEAAIADDTEHLDVETLAAFFDNCAQHEPVVLTGDLAGLGSPGAGRAFADIAESRLADVVRVDADPANTGEVLRGLAAAIARGELPATDDPSREVVTVIARSGPEAAYRVGQLVADSIPRACGIEPAHIQVLTPTAAGPCGPASLGPTLRDIGAPPAMTVHESLGRRWPAVVLALAPESAGVLTRALLHSAVTRASRHLSIVHAAGGALSDAVSQVPARPRRTLLPGLLAGYSSSGSHSSSSSSSSSTASTGPKGVTSSYAENSASS